MDEQKIIIANNDSRSKVNTQQVAALHVKTDDTNDDVHNLTESVNAVHLSGHMELIHNKWPIDFSDDQFHNIQPLSNNGGTVLVQYNSAGEYHVIPYTQWDDGGPDVRGYHTDGTTMINIKQDGIYLKTNGAVTVADIFVLQAPIGNEAN